MATGINEKSKQNPRFLYSSDRSKNVLRVRSRPVGLQPPITDEEQRQLKTIISKNEALERRRARDRKRDEERRRAAGAVERDVYEANSLTKQKPWEVLGMSRAKWYRLGKPSGSETTPSPITCHGQMAAKSA